METYSAWFESGVTAPGRPASRPHPWQQQLADEDSCVDRLIRIPTGLGKTLGVLLAWSYHRLHRQDTRWPRRLVWCLPMRLPLQKCGILSINVSRRAGSR